MKEIRWERVASRRVCLGVGCLAVWLAFRFLLPLLLPFLVAWGVSIAIRPLAKRLSMRLHVSQKLCSVLLLFFFLSGTLLLIGAALHRLILELEHLLERLLSEGGELSDAVEHSFDLFETLTSSIGFLRRVEAGERFSEFRDSFNSMVSNMLSAALTSLSSFLPQFAARLLSFLPSFLLVTVVTVVSGFYFCTEGDSITRGVLAVVPNAVTQRLPVWKQRVKLISWRYLRAYLLLLLLTFSELFLGFCVLRVEYAFLLAILIALVDMLPILGVGTPRHRCL